MIISWIVQDRVLLVDCGTKITMEEIFTMNKSLLRYLELSKTDLTILFLAEDLDDFPFTFARLHQAFTFLKHERLGITITIADKPMIRLISTVILYMLRIRLRHFVSTYDEAIALLKELQPELENVD